MTSPTPTLEEGRTRYGPPERGPRRWAAVVVVLGVLVALAFAIFWLFGREEPTEVVPTEPDGEAQQPEEADTFMPEEEPDASAPEQRSDTSTPEQQAGTPPPEQETDTPAPTVVFGEEPRANWDVTGISAGDRLNVRSGPGVHNPVTAALSADAVELESTGRIARVDGMLWREIVVPGDATGWVNARYLTETRPPAPPTGLADGRHATYLHELDVPGRTLTVDVIQFLTGQEAIDAYHAEFPEDPDGPPNDYWIVNANPRLRTLPVSADARVRLVRLAEDGDADLDPGTWDELPEYLAHDRPEDDRLSWNPFWVRVAGGIVTHIEEQYVP